MSDQVERRIADQDPVDVLTPEVFALLKLCGGCVPPMRKEPRAGLSVVRDLPIAAGVTGETRKHIRERQSPLVADL